MYYVPYPSLWIRYQLSFKKYQKEADLKQIEPEVKSAYIICYDINGIDK